MRIDKYKLVVKFAAGLLRFVVESFEAVLKEFGIAADLTGNVPDVRQVDVLDENNFVRQIPGKFTSVTKINSLIQEAIQCDQIKK